MPKISDRDYKVLQQAISKIQKSPSKYMQAGMSLEKLMGQTSVKKGSPTVNTQIQKFLQEQPLKQDPLKRQSQAPDRRLKSRIADLMPGESLRELADRQRQELFRTTRETEKDWRGIDPALKRKPATVYKDKKVRERTRALESVFTDVINEVKRVRGVEGLDLELLQRTGEKIALQSARVFTRANTTAYGFDAFSEYLSGKKETKNFVSNFKEFLSSQGLPTQTAEVLAAGFVGAAKLAYEGKFETGQHQFDVGRARVTAEGEADINTGAAAAAIDIRNLMDIAGGSLNVAGNIRAGNEFQNYAGEIEADWRDRNTSISAGLTADQQRIRQLQLAASYRDQGVDVSGKFRTDPNRPQYTSAQVRAAVDKPFGLDIGEVYAEASGRPLSNIQRARWEAGVENIPVGQRGRVSPYATGRGQELQEVGLRAGYDLGEFGEFSGRGSITPEGEGRATLEYTTPLDKITESLFKKGGKVTKKRKKRKTKKYSKGCVVRTAKY